MLCTAFPMEKTDALLAISTLLRSPNRLLQSGSLIKSVYLQNSAELERRQHHSADSGPLRAATLPDTPGRTHSVLHTCCNTRSHVPHHGAGAAGSAAGGHHLCSIYPSSIYPKMLLEAEMAPMSLLRDARQACSSSHPFLWYRRSPGKLSA